jgi:hypothetical protein
LVTSINARRPEPSLTLDTEVSASPSLTPASPSEEEEEEEAEDVEAVDCHSSASIEKVESKRATRWIEEGLVDATVVAVETGESGEKGAARKRREEGSGS